MTKSDKTGNFGFKAYFFESRWAKGHETIFSNLHTLIKIHKTNPTG